MVLGFSWQSLGLPLPLAICAGLAAGTLAGWLNGLIIVGLRVPPLIVTLATLAIYRGLSFGISESRSVNGFPDSFAFWGSGDIGGFPGQLYILLWGLIVRALALVRTPLPPFLLADRDNRTPPRLARL